MIKIIISVIIGKFLYDIILMAIGKVFIRRILEMKRKNNEYDKKLFSERIKEKQNQ